MIVYIAGKYSAPTPSGINRNIALARDVAVEVWTSGNFAFCPHLNTANFEKYAPAVGYDDYIERDLLMLARCDVILMLPGWKDSKGATAEHNHAIGRGMPVYYYPNLPPAGPAGARPFASVLEEAGRLVHGNRGADYGHPLDDFSKTAGFWSVLFGIAVTAEQVAMAMILLKMSRIMKYPKRDSIVDLPGYAETLAMVIHERERREYLKALHYGK